jgi:ammonium transporter, Amt family
VKSTGATVVLDSSQHYPRVARTTIKRWPGEPATLTEGVRMDSGDTSWVLASAALVLLMTPGLALFYGGMVRAKSVLNMMMMSFGSLALVSVLWVLYGYSMTFGTDKSKVIGDPGEYLGLKGLMDPEALSGTVPTMAFVAFQGVFAVITVALISGAIADRAKFGTWMVFVGIWVTLVYFPVAHSVWGGGWIMEDVEAIDFAGGTAVHINAGVAGLALALVLGKRIGFAKEPMRPHNLPLVMIGAGLLWFGWFGFNAGSAVAADATASVAWVNTFVATGAATLGWLLTERFRDGHATSLGAASGVVAGLVAITPACHSVSPVGAIVLGAIAGVLCALAVGLKYRFGYDDSLDVVGVHLVGGLVGTLAIGFLADPDAPAGASGLLAGGGASLLGKQAIGAFSVLGYSLIVTLIIGLVLEKTIGFRVTTETEVSGIDLDVHAESGYDLTPATSGAFRQQSSRAAAPTGEGAIA